MHRYRKARGWLAVVAVLAFTMAMRAPRAEEPANEPEQDPCSEEAVLGDAVPESEAKVVPPKLRTQVKPEYPKDANARRLEARVFLRAVVEKDGAVGCLKVESVEVMPQGEVHGDPGFDSFAPEFEAAAIKAARRWRFEPAKQKGEPIRVYFRIQIDFRPGFSDGRPRDGWGQSSESHPEN